MVELESPFASVVASGTQVYTFLLLGDQNAGKYSSAVHSLFAPVLKFFRIPQINIPARLLLFG